MYVFMAYRKSGTQDPGPIRGTQDLGHGSIGRTWDPGPRSLQLETFTWNLGPYMWEPGPDTFTWNGGPILSNPYIYTTFSYYVV